ncbi:MAG: SUMF1/EgtB/PvdO family nonheme iron enzyme [Planctomycetes bacterium]|nr:SUMF1/EgtB/PvdO family nonheme iron enzyme [Planctomycetota bacterium]
MTPSDARSQSRIEGLFADWLAVSRGPEAPSFEAFCALHPADAEALRALKVTWDRFESIARQHGLGGPRSLDELKRSFGGDVDPAVSIQGPAPKAESGSGPSSELLQRLRAHAPANSRYRILGEVGRGGMGAVLKIWDEDLRRTSAMKVVLGKHEGRGGDTPSADARTLGRFLEEAQVTGQLDHPGIVPVHELGLGADGRVYFTMRLVKGEDLRAIYGHVQSGHEGWNPTRALGVLLKVCEALAYAHDKGVIHRDLKPANIMVGRYGEVYVMDWGLARVLGAQDRHDIRLKPIPTSSQSVVDTERRAERDEQPDSPLVTMDGQIVGTPAYMPPEQARGEVEALGPQSDVYALGAMLYQLISGQMPFVPPGVRVSAHAVLLRVIDGPPRPLVELAPRAPAELVAICDKAMAREARARYRDMNALAEDLRAYLERRVVKAYESGTWAETKKWVQRNKALSGSMAAALVVVSGLGLYANSQAADAREQALRAERGESEARLQATRAESGEREAQQNAQTAQGNAEAARKARDEATQKANDVLALSAQKDLDDLVAEADMLWPAHPEMIERYESWLARARELLEGRPEALGRKRRPSLTEHQAKLADLRREARPLTADETRAERESHPKYPELQSKLAELLWQSRMLGLEPWPSEAEVEAALALEPLPADAEALNALALPLVDRATPVYGQEVRAVLLARRALAAAAEHQRSGIRDTVAWALLRAGRFDEALAEGRTALSEPGGAALKSSAADLEQAVASWREGQLAKRRAAHDKLSEDVTALTMTVSERRRFEFEEEEQAWWNRQLEKLVGDLEQLRDPERGLLNDVLAEPFGWGVAKRHAFAKSIAELSVEGADAKRRWDEAIAAIKASPMYGGRSIEAQMGLLPIGVDPHSQLWEFAHLQTGDPAVRGADGKLVLTEATGLVFVLIPGGTFWMGAQNKPGAQNHDPQATRDEGPVHEVELSPYFLSKYELTQGQWRRITGTNPSNYQPPYGWTPTVLHPVEQVSWTTCRQLMERLGLALPSEAQWEHGARGWTSTPWSTGAERESLRGNVNLADQTAHKAGAPWSAIHDWPDLTDGSVVHAAVGKYGANPFGLHDVHGNVWEWCLDGYDAGFYAKNPGQDPVSPWSGSASRVARGGSFNLSALYARSAYRAANTPGLQDTSIGLRPSRALHASASPGHTPR